MILYGKNYDVFLKHYIDIQVNIIYIIPWFGAEN